jgi:hypothetical protein
MMKGRPILISVLALGLMLALAAGLSLAQGPGPQGDVGIQAAPVSSGFTYQGRLTDGGGNPVNDTCSLDFTLWDAESGGALVGHQLVTGVEVNDGYLTVLLNSSAEFGADAFEGEERWLKIGVKCSSDADWNVLSGRQLLSAAPYALSLRPGARIVGEQAGSPTLHVQNDSSANTAIRGYTSAATGFTVGVTGQSASTDGRGVLGLATASTGETYGVYGQSASTDGRGVLGDATATSGTTYGVWGQSASTDGCGVYGLAYATSGTNYGVFGWTNSSSGYAGYFWGDVHVTGDLSASGTKAFKIDHPLDPVNSYLYHFAQEGPEVQNVYNGVVALDANGEAVVTLPGYFAALNTGPYLYQLTPIGAPMPNLYIAEEIQGNAFRIAGGVPGKKVSWEVTAVRNDPYLRDHPVQAEQDKPADERGTYLYPEGYAQPQEMGLDYQRNAELFEQPPETPPIPTGNG